MVSKFTPEVNKLYFINKYSVFHILKGNGGIEVDFKKYHDWADKIIFLDKGQYIKFLTEKFLVRKIEFEDELEFRNKDVRVLFKHLVSLGYINFSDCNECEKYLNNTIFSKQLNGIIDVSSKQWHWLNPFNANKEEYHLIFDVKEIIDKKYKNHLKNSDLIGFMGNQSLNPQALFSSKVGITIKGLLGNKRLLESKKEIAFSDKSIKEIAYEFGYKDPAYFNRVFKNNTGLSPAEFRDINEISKEDVFLQELYDLLSDFHSHHRSIEFYANKMNMSVKTISKKVREKLQISIGQLIRQELITTAKKKLLENTPVNEIAYMLGFEESNHFSTFFKHHTGVSPSEFKN